MKRKLIALLLAILAGCCSVAAADNAGNSWWMMPTPVPTETPVPGYDYGVPDQTQPAAVLTPAPVQTYSYGAFSFRNGVYWNMTPEQVLGTEAMALTRMTNGNWTVLFQEKAAVSTYTAQLVYMFRDGLLQMINYDFVTGANTGDYAYLSEALSSVYGTPETANTVDIYAAMNQVDPGRYRVSALRDARVWRVADGTSIYLYWYSGDAYAILYVSPAAAAGTYNTTGL